MAGRVWVFSSKNQPNELMNLLFATAECNPTSTCIFPLPKTVTLFSFTGT
jgi:hypothetical protein